jgi:hypothetical protein
MARIIPNNNSYIAFVTTILSGTLNPTAAEISGGVNLTPFTISINASTTGNTVATPSFDNVFETNIPGTITATFEADFYRDDALDTAWLTLPRATKGYFVISRFGGTGTNHIPVATNKVEVWPVTVQTRSAQNMTNNTAQTMTVQCSVTTVPNEAAVVS